MYLNIERHLHIHVLCTYSCLCLCSCRCWYWSKLGTRSDEAMKWWNDEAMWWSIKCCRTPSSRQWTNVRTMKLKDTVIFTVAGAYRGAVCELPSEAVRPYGTVILTSKGLSSCGAWVRIPAMAVCSPYRLLSTPAVPYSRAVIKKGQQVE